MATGRQNFQTKEERRKAKELEEARKAGTAPAELDEEGNEINPHIPQYIAQAPWYIDQGGPSLKHQKIHKSGEEGSGISSRDWYKRGQKAGPAAKNYRKGACENCGAMTHSRRDCVERPRKVGAKYTSRDIQADEIIVNLEGLTYDQKRDRWNGYDTAQHKKLMEMHEKVEAERAKKKEALALEKKAKGEVTVDDSDSDSENDDFKDAHEVQAGQKFDVKTRTTIRNLRIREDTAKYLRNLDPKSAYYDPKTRSMRANPTPQAPADELTFAGDNFVRSTGDTVSYKDLEHFAWQAYEKGKEIHVQGVPSQAEFFYKQFKEKKSSLQDDEKKSVLEKYGGDKHVKQLPQELVYAQTEEYYEYAPDGRLIKGQEKAVAKSKYEEDQYVNNHKSVWGSYWENGNWGYKCCHGMLKNSYCTGEAGKSSKLVGSATSVEKRKERDEEDDDKDMNAKEDSEGETENDRKRKKRKVSVR
tara:strand:- start:229 stop:1644 length:1416 start_codon:yes stop_codon:yes gene_type:complete